MADDSNLIVLAKTLDQMRVGLDLYIALVIGTCSIVAAYLAYQQVRGSEPELYLELGNAQAYTITQNGTCVGFVRSQMLYEDLREFKVEGALYLECPAGDCPKKAVFEVRSFFNPLGQLFQARGGLVFQDTSFSATLLDASPHRVEVELNAPQAKYRQSFVVPGPVTLVANPSNQSHIVDFSVFGDLVRSGTTPVINLGERTLGLAVSPTAAIPETCNGQGTISLAPLVQELLMIRNRIQGIGK